MQSCSKTITCIRGSNGGLVTDQKFILEECRLFYKKLYTKNKDIEKDSFERFTSNSSIPKLDEEAQMKCEQELSEQELFSTLKAFKKNKSPGLDGLTAEFYLDFWEVLKTKLLEVYKEAYLSGTLPESMTKGVIVLLEKKGKNRTELSNWRPITLLGVDYKLLTKALAERLKKVLPILIHPDQNGFVPGGNLFFSTHTVRDILFHCKKENIDLIMLALDYTKAFDSVEFSAIHKTFEVFNFGDYFRRWIQILFKGGTSCVANNGFISSAFPIERSTRQGDPISPLIFILVLEILFISIRENTNIEGITVLKSEIKLTSYADDATYFLKNRISAEILLSKIAEFSKVSGLEINKSKSECLLLDFEMHLSSDELCGIPVVENVKILGHYFGKNKIICDYQNFYSKLSKFERITAVWKQRGLTIVGRNLLINSLLNTLFLFNAQVEIPPCDFIKIAEAKNKDFLWNGGVAKIAHHSLIGDYDQGGIRYKDIATTIKSLCLKFLVRLSSTGTTNSTCLPKLWIRQIFKIPTEYNNAETEYFASFFDSRLEILDCKFNLPKKNHWRGHPFYYDALLTYQQLSLDNQPKSFEANMSIPLWYNKMLETSFDAKLSKLGYNYISDLFNHSAYQNDFLVANKVLHLKNKLNHQVRKLITENLKTRIVIYPFQTIRCGKEDKPLCKLNARNVYDLLISSKIRSPTGLLNWCLEWELSEIQIRTALTFVKKCTPSIQDRVFQYKIVTNILPTNEFLKRYRAKDSDLCDLCKLECDTIVHRLYDCEIVSNLVGQILDILYVESSQTEDISMVDYLFGLAGNEYIALNHIILELKKLIFYSDLALLNFPGFKDLFFSKVRALIIKEKYMSQKSQSYEKFEEKWKEFTFIYDFRGPDVQWSF